MAPLKTIDLFCGAGGFSLGAHLAGFRTVLAVDIDPDLSASLASNFPGTKLLVSDLKTCAGGEILAAAGAERGEIAGVLGGPPCQGFSAIGKRERGDPRNQLISHFFRHVAAIEPAFFVFENVPGILDDPYQTILSRSIERVAAKYTITGPIEFDALEFGAATRRERVIVVGIDSSRVQRFDANALESLKNTSGDHPTVYHAIHDLPEPHDELWRKYDRTPDRGRKGAYARLARLTPENGIGDKEAVQKLKGGFTSGFAKTYHTRDVIKRFEKTLPGQTESISRCPRLTWDKPCTTLRAGTGKDKGKYQSIRPIHPERDRVITVREAARIQGFPDWFLFHETKWHSFRMIGNSVSPKLSATLLRFIASQIKIVNGASSKFDGNAGKTDIVGCNR